uniref:Predicted ATPase n=1 Tax=Candidatus Kentrum sp. MB TaxID=2138164 RepID=A0A450XJL0_9GAMM|nr:MAG: Predicted ATPase [Candidatus Kentron sp. MB]VFK74784.1 MAG: Predicted ATPase [Candidatus Kentron sp. MB]
MTDSAFLTRVILRNYKSIANCDVRLGPLTYLVGPNGSGKSNFLDALHFVRNALENSLENALNLRGGVSEVRRGSSGRPTHFGIRFEFRMRDGQLGYYAFQIGAVAEGLYEVQTEECTIGGKGKGPFFLVERGKVVETSEKTFPAVMPDRLALVNASGSPAFRPVFDALMAMGFYNLNPKLIRDHQKPQDGRILKSAGENIASVIGHLERTAPESKKIIEEYLQIVVPTIRGVRRERMGSMETLEFRENVAWTNDPWSFDAGNVSDGTLRALGILTALFQGNRDYAPSLIGIEEPETALHPGASGALREALQRASEKAQVLVTTHSPELLDDMDLPLESLFAVKADDGETRLAPVDEGSKKALRERLFSAGELLRLNQLEPDPDDLSEQERSGQSVLFGEWKP